MSEDGTPFSVTTLTDPADLEDVEDWGPIATMIEGQSHTSGKVIHKGPDGESECGVWICTPGYWECDVTRAEFCHFIEGRATYTHESGDVIEIEPDTIAFFPAGWSGTCRVHETVRKTYMIR
ncbi:MAG: cupin domain-containing protein [Halobacteriota archaeon]